MSHSPCYGEILSFVFLHRVTKCPWHILATSFQSLEPWIGSRLCGCIFLCPVSLVCPGGYCSCPFLPQPAGLGYVLSNTPTAFIAEGRYFRTKSIIMDLRNPGFPTCGPSLSLSPEEMEVTTHNFKVLL